MEIRIDIDNTICDTDNEYGYENAIPIYSRIKKINKWYEQGHTIIMWTSRGVGSGQNFRPLTERQLKQWQVKYHHLYMDKPLFDMFIDDKAFNCDLLDK